LGISGGGGKMKPKKESVGPKRRGAALILSMIFVLIFSALAVSMATISGANAQLASNQHKINSALYAAASALECGKYIMTE
jgi:Tfp pilus assembly protein PilX